MQSINLIIEINLEALFRKPLPKTITPRGTETV